MSTDANSPPPFLKGANLPWVHYGIDFGRNLWRPEGGVSQPEEQRMLDSTFAGLAASGVQWVRWFLLCDGRAGIEYTAGGRPSGLDEKVMADIDAALGAARRHGIRIMFVLFDFLWCADARLVRGVQLGGRGHMWSDRGQQDVLLDTVIQPILDRYGHDPAIFAWDIVNEPEWIRTVEWPDIASLIRRCASLVHTLTSHPATVGSAGVRWRDRYRALDLDFFQVHWYDSLKHQPSLDTPIGALGFDRPVLLGEFPTRGSARTSDDIFETARAAGYSGAFYWSVLSKDESSANDT
jgi:hypothetical protein